jgi:cellulose synthase/poly-beta-1,6-N-acetylglucosamine synthase-like glycosyltransferase
VVPHKWKAYAMNEGINKYLKWEIIISTDANAYFKKDVISKVVQHFYDEKVWWVSGAMMQIDESQTSESEGSSIYWKIEKFLRIQESRYHSSICMNGEITCIRKSIVVWKNWYFKWDPDDFDLSLFIIQSGYRIIYEPNAKVWETAPDTASDIEKQKTRIIVQTLSAFTHYYKVLVIKRYWFILFSHKLLALLSPFFLMGMYISNIFLLDSNMFLFLFVLQNILYISYIFKLDYGPLRITNFFIFLNYLILKSYIMFFSWRDFTKWDKIMSSRK